MKDIAKPEQIAILDNLLGLEARKWGNARKLPSALRVTEKLEPVGGFQIPVYPASYAGVRDNDPAQYDLSGIQEGPEQEIRGKGDTVKKVRVASAKHCVIDSYQSQANRMEPAFKDEALKALVPAHDVAVPRKKGTDEPEVQDSMSVLEVAHRIADFRIGLSDQAGLVKETIRSFDNGDALPLIRLMPTSVLLGFWDSRDLGTKHARMLMARIDAFDVVPCQKHSIYSGQYSKEEVANLFGEALDGKDDQDILSARGFTNAPGSGLGGVLVRGGITRTAILSFTDIARIHCMNGAEVDVVKTNAARRYLFCLGLLAEAYQRECGTYNLRSGCELQQIEPETYELRGGCANEELLNLCKNQQSLIALAKEAITVLGAGERKTFTVSTDSLKAEFNESKGKKDDKKAKAAAKKAAKKSASSSDDSDEAGETP